MIETKGHTNIIRLTLTLQEQRLLELDAQEAAVVIDMTFHEDTGNHQARRERLSRLRQQSYNRLIKWHLKGQGFDPKGELTTYYLCDGTITFEQIKIF